MNHTEFAQLVAVHGLPITWLARHVGRVSDRTMQYWVAGRPGHEVNVPADAVQRLQRLNNSISKALN